MFSIRHGLHQRIFMPRVSRTRIACFTLATAYTNAFLCLGYNVHAQLVLHWPWLTPTHFYAQDTPSMHSLFYIGHGLHQRIFMPRIQRPCIACFTLAMAYTNAFLCLGYNVHAQLVLHWPWLTPTHFYAQDTTSMHSLFYIGHGLHQRIFMPRIQRPCIACFTLAMAYTNAFLCLGYNVHAQLVLHWPRLTPTHFYAQDTTSMHSLFYIGHGLHQRIFMPRIQRPCIACFTLATAYTNAFLCLGYNVHAQLVLHWPRLTPTHFYAQDTTSMHSLFYIGHGLHQRIFMPRIQRPCIACFTLAMAYTNAFLCLGYNVHAQLVLHWPWLTPTHFYAQDTTSMHSLFYIGHGLHQRIFMPRIQRPCIACFTLATAYTNAFLCLGYNVHAQLVLHWPLLTPTHFYAQDTTSMHSLFYIGHGLHQRIFMPRIQRPCIACFTLATAYTNAFLCLGYNVHAQLVLHWPRLTPTHFYAQDTTSMHSLFYIGHGLHQRIFMPRIQRPCIACFTLATAYTNAFLCLGYNVHAQLVLHWPRLTPTHFYAQDTTSMHSLFYIGHGLHQRIFMPRIQRPCIACFTLAMAYTNAFLCLGYNVHAQLVLHWPWLTPTHFYAQDTTSMHSLFYIGHGLHQRIFMPRIQRPCIACFTLATAYTNAFLCLGYNVHAQLVLHWPRLTPTHFYAQDTTSMHSLFYIGHGLHQCIFMPRIHRPCIACFTLAMAYTNAFLCLGYNVHAQLVLHWPRLTPTHFYAQDTTSMHSLFYIGHGLHQRIFMPRIQRPCIACFTLAMAYTNAFLCLGYTVHAQLVLHWPWLTPTHLYALCTTLTDSVFYIGHGLHPRTFYDFGITPTHFSFFGRHFVNFTNEKLLLSTSSAVFTASQGNIFQKCSVSNFFLFSFFLLFLLFKFYIFSSLI